MLLLLSPVGDRGEARVDNRRPQYASIRRPVSKPVIRAMFPFPHLPRANRYALPLHECPPSPINSGNMRDVRVLYTNRCE